MSSTDLVMGAAGAGGAPATYVEDVFSTWLYTGNGSTQTITNGIDLAGKGGLVWGKSRSTADWNYLFDSARGVSSGISSNSTGAAFSAALISSFNSNGFAVTTAGGNAVNASGTAYASWTFRKAPKFFDVVTYTGNGTAGRTIAHSLGSVPGMIIVKATSTANAWTVYHRSLNIAGGGSLYLNSTSAQDLDNTNWNSTAATSTVFTLGSGATNTNGATYVAYLFAHDAGGFGLSETDNVISCGSFVPNSSEMASINLGFEPQYVLIKQVSGTGGNWDIHDVMRGTSLASTSRIYANLSNAESVNTSIAMVKPNSTGFDVQYYNRDQTHIYMAIRRPMKPPTSGTEVFSPVQTSGIPSTGTTGFPVDLNIQGSTNKIWSDRLRGSASNLYNYLNSTNTAGETTGTGNGVGLDNNTGFTNNLSNITPLYNWNFRRATGFFDVVCYTGTGSARTVAHNLGVVPELMIVKRRNVSNSWIVYASPIGNTKYLSLNSTDASDTVAFFNNTSPTSSVFSLGAFDAVNSSGSTYVAYLFASVAGVSKVFSFTGNGSSQTINCGFTGGARFVMIKRTDSTGDWFVWDTARGIASGNDPHLSLNTTAAEVTTDDSIDAASSGFVVNQLAATNINVSSATYIGLAIA